MTDQAPIAQAIRHDGWTPVRRVQFLDHLAADGSVRGACRRVGMSREAAYRFRRRDALFARGWDAALVLGRAASADVLEDRAIHGVEEEVWYRGELVGTRRKYDARLLLAHMARLDQIAENGLARDDAARFDELLAHVGGERVAQGCDCDDEGVPLDREVYIEFAVEDAEIAFADAWTDEHPEADEDEEEADPEEVSARLDREVAEHRAYEAALGEERLRARLGAGAEWDERRAQSHAAVDLMLAEPLLPDAEARTVSTVSTSPAETPAAPTWRAYHLGLGPRP
jgi:hypothetical protein